MDVYGVHFYAVTLIFSECRIFYETLSATVYISQLYIFSTQDILFNVNPKYVECMWIGDMISVIVFWFEWSNRKERK